MSWRLVLGSEQVSSKQVSPKQVFNMVFNTYILDVITALSLSLPIVALSPRLIEVIEIPKSRIPYSTVAHCWIKSLSYHPEHPFYFTLRLSIRLNVQFSVWLTNETSIEA
jgi:hypothetical protein